MKKIKKKGETLNNRRVLFFGVALVATVPLALYTLPNVTKTDYEVIAPSAGEENVIKSQTQEQASPAIVHVNTPEAVRAVYMTSCVAGTPSFREDLVQLIEETELNSVVLDIKDYSGTISFAPQSPLLQGAWENARCGARDMKEFIEELHEKNIYVIGRITVFQDPYYSLLRPDLAVKRESDGGVWEDYKGLSFIDVGAREYWDYIIELSKDSYNLGFDELNFDYVRFPSDGNMKDIAFEHTHTSKANQLEEFFSYLNERLTDSALFGGTEHRLKSREMMTAPVLSVDIFGMTTTNTDDLNIGQVLERTLPYFDYVSPMVYPSHYPKGFNGWENPNNFPYDVIHFAMQSAVERAVSDTTTVETLTTTPIFNTIEEFNPEVHATTSKQVFSGLYAKKSYSPNVLRPWLQDFDYGGDYDVEEVRAQIQATYDVGLNSWMLWAPSNRYTRGALDSARGE